LDILHQPPSIKNNKTIYSKDTQIYCCTIKVLHPPYAYKHTQTPDTLQHDAITDGEWSPKNLSSLMESKKKRNE
jgi:hypothetical protein